MPISFLVPLCLLLLSFLFVRAWQARLGLEVAEILYCGDHTVDALAAARAEVGGFIGVLTGATGEAKLRKAIATGVAENGWAPRLLEVLPGAGSVPHALGLRETSSARI